MIDPASLFVIGCWASLKIAGWIAERPSLMDELTKDAERF